MRSSRRFENLFSALAGAVVGAVLVLGVDGVTRIAQSPQLPSRRPSIEVTKEPPITPSDQVLLVWAPSGVPRSLVRAVAELDWVTEVAQVNAGLDWIESSHSPDGSPVDAPQGGKAIPIEVAAIRPRAYARFVPAGNRAEILALEPGGAVLARTAGKLRGAGEGLRLDLRSGPTKVTGVVSDEATGGYEMLIAGPPRDSWARVERFLLIRADQPDTRALQRVARRILGRGVPFRIRMHGETPFLRHGDAVLPQLLLKDNFGEFAAAPRSDGHLDMDPTWARRHIATQQVPVLGRVTCHVAVLPQLREALAEIERSGLGFLLDPSDYGGCYSPRFINAMPDSRVSHHSWGTAIDLNVTENPYGAKSGLDRRVVDIMERWGFSWGGRWLVPDGMHFEWTRFP